MYQRRPDVIALAKLRVDRKNGPGAWDGAVEAVFNGKNGALSSILDQALTEELSKAEQDLADVQMALPERKLISEPGPAGLVSFNEREAWLQAHAWAAEFAADNRRREAEKAFVEAMRSVFVQGMIAGHENATGAKL